MRRPVLRRPEGGILNQTNPPNQALRSIGKLWRAGTSAPIIVGQFVYWALNKRYGSRWRASRFQLGDRDREADPNLRELFAFRWREVPDEARLALYWWSQGLIPLRLVDHVPKVLDMLAAQSQGERYVTLILDPERTFRPIEDHVDAFQFLIHDLIHAAKFFRTIDDHENQKQIYFRLWRALTEHPDLARGDLAFEQGFNYVASDMNSHPVHMLLTLIAARREYLVRSGLSILEIGEWWRQLMGISSADDPLWTLLDGRRPSSEDALRISLRLTMSAAR